MGLPSYCLVLWMLLAFRLPGAAGVLQIDQTRSEIEVAVNSTANNFIARLEDYQATIECESLQPLPSRADVTFDFKRLKTGAKGRDTHMLQWLQYSKYPTGSFHLKNWKQEGGGFLAVGNLSIHGVSREVRMPVSVKRHEDDYDIEGAVGLDYRDFGLRRIRQVLVFSVDPRLKIKFHLVGKIEH